MTHAWVDERLIVPEDWARARGIMKRRVAREAAGSEDRGIVMLFRLFVKRMWMPPERTYEVPVSSEKRMAVNEGTVYFPPKETRKRT